MPGQNQCILERLPDVLKWWLSWFRTAYKSCFRFSYPTSLALKIVWGWFKSKRSLYCFGVHSSLILRTNLFEWLQVWEHFNPLVYPHTHLEFKMEFLDESSLRLLLNKYLSFKWVSISNLVWISVNQTRYVSKEFRFTIYQAHYVYDRLLAKIEVVPRISKRIMFFKSL